MDSLVRHVVVFSILFVPLFVYTRWSLFIILFIQLPIIGEVIQIGFPPEWMFSFEYQDICFNFIGAIFGSVGGVLCLIVTGAAKKIQLRQ